MKKIQMLAILGVALVFSGVARATSFEVPGAITIAAVNGEARYSTDGNTWHPLVVGKVLRAGAVIETAAGSTADLVLSGTPVSVPETSAASQNYPNLTYASDPNIRGFVSYTPVAQQNVIRMGSGTMLAVDKLGQINTGADSIGDTELDLRAGKVFINAKKMSPNSQYIIKLPNGVAGIRGSCGSLTIKPNQDFQVDWLIGEIVVSGIGPDGQPHVKVVDGGNEYDPQTGDVVPLPSELIQLLGQFQDSTSTTFSQTTPLAFDVSGCPLSGGQGNKPNTVTGGGGGGGGVVEGGSVGGSVNPPTP
jgi:hypothetical protein